jgi:hypothetical protein
MTKRRLNQKEEGILIMRLKKQPTSNPDIKRKPAHRKLL